MSCPDLSITIASYNSRQVTCETLTSIFESTTAVDFEIIVVDNASTDGSADEISCRFPAVRLIRSAANLGFAKAQNLALSQARGEYLLVLNSDVQFVGNTATQLVEQLRDGDARVGAVGPQILNVDGSLAPSSRRRIFYSKGMVGLSVVNQFFSFSRFLPVGFLRRYCGSWLAWLHDTFDPPKSAEEVEWVDGMCVLFRRTALDHTGLFDEQYFFDYEIGDLLIRLRDKGWGVVFQPAIKVVHLGGYSRRRLSRIAIESHRSFLIYYAKHKPTYVPALRNLLVCLTWVKVRHIKLSCWLRSPETNHQEVVETLEKIMAVASDFTIESANRSRIPQLPVLRGSLPERAGTRQA